MKKLKTLFYGLTHEHACGKFQTLERLADQYEIIGIVDDRATATRPYFLDQKADPGRHRVLSADEALALEDMDVAFIEVANADLMKVATPFVERGIAMHCDKPCGETMEPYRSLVEKCRARNLPFQIGYMYRGNPALKWIWQYVAEGNLGDIRFIEADMNHNYQAPGYEEYLATFKGGIFYNLGCHLIDMIMPMVKGEVKYVDSHLETMRGTVNMRIGDTEVLLRTQPYMPGGILTRRLRIDGTLGTIDLCPIERFDGKELQLLLNCEPMKFGVQTDRYAEQLLDLAAIIRGDKPNDQDYNRDLRVHELLLQACGL